MFSESDIKMKSENMKSEINVSRQLLKKNILTVQTLIDPNPFKGGTKEVQVSQEETSNEVAPCNDKTMLKYILKVSR